MPKTAAPTAAAVKLRITEIFFSLQGESRSAGFPTVFVRLTGCPLRCQYCDTEYAFHGGDNRTLDDVLTEVANHPTRFVCVTGGEPMAQKGCPALLTALCDRGYEVSLETSGAMDLSAVDPRVVKVMDLKTPDSGEQSRNRWENLPLLDDKDQVKFVICSRSDFDWATAKVREHQLCERCEVLFSPSHQQVDAKQLAEWVIDSGLPVRFQMQLHKLLWGEEPGH